MCIRLVAFIVSDHFARRVGNKRDTTSSLVL